MKLFPIQANLCMLAHTVNSKVVAAVQKLLREILFAMLSETKRSFSSISVYHFKKNTN